VRPAGRYVRRWLDVLGDLVADTARSLVAHRLRYGLTSSGIVWGIAMLTFLSAAMDGYDAHFERQTTKVGQRVVFLFPGWVTKPGVGQRSTRPIELEIEDVRRLEALDSVEAAGAALFLRSLMLRAGARTKLVWSYGATESTLQIRNYGLGAGRFLTRRDVDGAARVVFLGARVAERLFGGRDAVGREVLIESIPFRVVGVSAPKGDQLVYMGPPDDEVAFVPVTTAQRWLTRDDQVGQVIFAPRTRALGWAALDAVRGLLGLHHDFRPGDEGAMSSFYVIEALQIVELLLLGLRIFLTAAIAITLLVGAAGVMNVMFVVVTERTREIGLRKAIGASNGAIFVQFLAEAFAVTALSGALGAALGWLAVRAAQAMIGEGSTMAPVPQLQPLALLVIVATMVVVGLAAGILPAARASRVDPAVSLRSA
jgi:putative ABC transport system permease protein